MVDSMGTGILEYQRAGGTREYIGGSTRDTGGRGAWRGHVVPGICTGHRGWYGYREVGVQGKSG